jgi:hypothetical protein
MVRVALVRLLRQRLHPGVDVTFPPKNFGVRAGAGNARTWKLATLHLFPNCRVAERDLVHHLTLRQKPFRLLWLGAFAGSHGVLTPLFEGAAAAANKKGRNDAPSLSIFATNFEGQLLPARE